MRLFAPHDQQQKDYQRHNIVGEAVDVSLVGLAHQVPATVIGIGVGNRRRTRQIVRHLRHTVGAAVTIVNGGANRVHDLLSATRYLIRVNAPNLVVFGLGQPALGIVLEVGEATVGVSALD